MAQRTNLLNDSTVLAGIKGAWTDSEPGVTGGHEEGGFIVQDRAGNLSVIRWPRGEQFIIKLPPHPNCQINDNNIIATFHTHTNTGSDFLQEPGPTDKRAIRDGPDLKGLLYEGEFVISMEKIYLISPNGQVNEIGKTKNFLK